MEEKKNKGGLKSNKSMIIGDYDMPMISPEEAHESVASHDEKKKKSSLRYNDSKKYWTVNYKK